ncbi:MAG: erythromycin esterase family protein [Chloroflexi bacterium]|nr:erythromycin esterase family protein [Chloroflexota bacterium]
MVSTRNGCVSALLLALLLFIPTGCTTAPAPSPTYCSPSDHEVAPATTAWLREKAIPLADNSARDWQDLGPLKQMIGEARIVALGEATHGTREFFDAKRRLLQFLVEQMGFNTFAIEANGPEADRINAYLQTGQGDPAQLLAALQVWPWNTREVLEMIEWMRAHNRQAGDGTTLTFRGFDMQLPRAAMDDLVRYMQQVDPSNNQTESALACYRQFQDATFGYATVDPATQQKCREGLERVYAELQRQRAAYEQESSPEEYQRALRAARLTLQAEERYRTMANRDLRDAFMAENLTWILDNGGPQAKVILWAHNTHVDAALPMTKSMGTYLRERFGREYLSMGFAFYRGSFNAMEFDSAKNRYGAVAIQQAALPPANSHESYFHAVGLPRFLLDLRELESEENAETVWMTGPHPFRSIGAVYDPSRPLDYCYDARLPEEFDLIVYFDETSPSELLSK